MVLIESDVWRLWSDPEQGVQWLAAQVKHRQQWHPIVPDCMTQLDAVRKSDTAAIAGQSPAAPLAAASFHMIPYSNRIRDAQFTFNDEMHILDGTEVHAIHGALRKLPWRLISADSHSMLCEFDSRQNVAINWPWPIVAQIRQSVDGDTLFSTITISNHGKTDMPVGTGWHPYFVRQIGGGGATLTLPVDAVFPDANGDCLPDGAAVDLPPELDFTKPRTLDPDQRIDCCLAGLSGACHIHWQDAGIELIMGASDNCRYLVLFNPDMPHFAVEPVTNANDAFNLSARGIASGTVTLGAGESFTASLQLRARLHN